MPARATPFNPVAGQSNPSPGFPTHFRPGAGAARGQRVDDIPDSRFERAAMMEGILLAHATGGSADGHAYEHLRREFMTDPSLKPLLPQFVRTCRDLPAFWSLIKQQFAHYEQRRVFIRHQFTDLMEYLEGQTHAPADAAVGDALASFDPEGVHAVWTKALARRDTDPEGAITVARTLLETVCKRILDVTGPAYADKDDLPKLFGLAARALKLAPDQHTEEPIRMILGGATTLVNGIGTLRNRLSDAHGQGVSRETRRPVRPSPRHASLAVNTAGAMATFLVETFQERRGP